VEKKEKIVEIQLPREDIDCAEIKNIKEHFICQLIQKDIEIKELKRKY
jgi:hypothetical protein